MNPFLASIKAELEARPGYVKVDSSGKQLYALVDDQLFVLLGEDLHLMNEEQINQFICDTLNKVG